MKKIEKLIEFETLFYDFELQMMNEEMWASKAEVHRGKMHDTLGLKPNERVSDRYKNGRKLAADLLRANRGDRKKTAGQLAFAANIRKGESVFDDALSYLKNVK